MKGSKSQVYQSNKISYTGKMSSTFVIEAIFRVEIGFLFIEHLVLRCVYNVLIKRALLILQNYFNW